MHIVFCYENAHLLEQHSYDSNLDHITKQTTIITEIFSLVSSINTQLLVLIGYEQDQKFIDSIKKIKNNLPEIDLIVHVKQLSSNFLLDLMEAGVTQVLKNLDESTLIDSINKIRLKKSERKLTSKIAQKIAFMSAKGGDGGTCVAANFAQSLSNQKSLKILCIDLSLPFGDLEMYLTRQKSRHDLSDFTTEIDRLDGALLELMVNKLKSNFHVIGTPQSFDKVILINAQHIDRLVDIAERIYDFIIIDVGAGIDPISLRILERIDQLIIVGTLTIPSIKRATQLLNLWQTLGLSLDKISIVANRVSSQSEITSSDFETTVNRKILLSIPDDTDNIESSLIKGSPLVEINSTALFSQQIINWVCNYTGQPANIKLSNSLWNRLKRK